MRVGDCLCGAIRYRAEEAGVVLPERLGNYWSVKRRYYRWIATGGLDGMLEALAREADQE